MKPHYNEFYEPYTRTFYDGRAPILIGMNLSKDDRVQCDVTRPGNMITPLPWHFTYENRLSVKGDAYRYSRGKLVDSYSGPMGVFPAYTPHTQQEEENVYNDALADLNEQLRGNVDLSVDLGQMAQTKRMLSASAQVEDKIDPIIKAVKKKLKRKEAIARMAIGQVSSAYLEWKYGIKPLLQTIHDAATVLHNMADTGTFSARGRASLTSDGQWTGIIPVAGVSVPYDNTFRVITRKEVKIWIELGSYHPTAVQLSSMNPLSIAWELMPWSFVVDWFVNISGYMRDLETAIAYGSYFRMGYVTTSRLVDAQLKPRNQPVTAGSLVVQPQLTQGQKMMKSSFRIVLSSYPMPNRPSVNIGMGSSSLLSTAALLAQKLK